MMSTQAVKIHRGFSNVLLMFVVWTIVFTPHVAMSGEKQLVIAATAYWEPYTGEKLENGGMWTEITVEAFQRVGYDVRVKFYPLKRAIEMTKSGKTDVFIGLFYSKERAEWFGYSAHAYDVHMMIFTLKGRAPSSGALKLKDFCPARIGLGRGSLYEKEIRAIPCLEISKVTTLFQSIQMLLARRIDLFIGAQDWIYYLLQNDFPDIAVGEVEAHPFRVVESYTVVSKTNPGYQDILDDFDKGIQALKDDGTYGNIVDKHAVR